MDPLTNGEAKRKELEEQIKRLEQRHKSQLSTNDLTQLYGVAVALYKDEISGAFATFYKKLYSNVDMCTEFEKINAYLEGINLPKLSEEDSQVMDRPITREEIVERIKGLKNGKSPGSDGYCNKVYKTFVDD